METGIVICDTNIFINWFNNDKPTIKTLKTITKQNICMSVVTKMELLQGMGNKQELRVMRQRIADYHILHFSKEISKLCAEYMETYHLSHSLQIPDAIIAATAVQCELPLFTYNLSDFRFIQNLQLYPH